MPGFKTTASTRAPPEEVLGREAAGLMRVHLVPIPGHERCGRLERRDREAQMVRVVGGLGAFVHGEPLRDAVALGPPVQYGVWRGPRGRPEVEPQLPARPVPRDYHRGGDLELAQRARVEAAVRRHERLDGMELGMPVVVPAVHHPPPDQVNTVPRLRPGGGGNVPLLDLGFQVTLELGAEVPQPFVRAWLALAVQARTK